MKRRTNEKNKQAQVTIFVIIALMLIVVIALLFLLFRKPVVEIRDVENPQSYIESCVKEYAEEAIDLLSSQGGDLVPEGSAMYNGKNITYLCYNANYYVPCINQRPMLIEHLEEETTNYIRPKVENCFQGLKAKLEEKNHFVEMGNMKLTTELQKKQVIININREFKMSIRGESREFDNFKIRMVSPLYELSDVAMDIVNSESKYCNFDILSYMIMYPEYDIDKYRPGNSDVIYSIRHRNTNQKFLMAVRSCALPPGF